MPDEPNGQGFFAKKYFTWILHKLTFDFTGISYNPLVAYVKNT